MASLAKISVEWYTRLEQGRGGAPSPQVLDAVATALVLTEDERKHLFQLAQGRNPNVGTAVEAAVRERLQRVLDGFPFSPAFIKTAAWDVVAWNHAAEAVLTDYAALPGSDRNILRILFLDQHSREHLENWRHEAGLAVATFRLELARSGGGDDAAAVLIADLYDSSPDFAAMWDQQDVGTLREGTKYLIHPLAGRLAMHYSSYSVDDLPGLGLVVYTPATHSDTQGIRELLAGWG